VLRNSEIVIEPPTDDPARTFTMFVTNCEPKLRRALVALYGTERGRDATAEALAYAWEHWAELDHIDNLPGYLFRIAQSKSRQRRTPAVFVTPPDDEHPFEPKLPGALRALSEQQRLCVVLIHGFGWQLTEVAELISCKPTTVQKHVERGLRRLRRSLGADTDAD
jgi:DNA-directed RNA polymerase specialized sigma24 family protein